MQAFVTGAAGFLGTHVVYRLVNEGVRVRALAQSRDEAERLNHPLVEPVIGDLLDSPALRSHVAGAELVFHCAAKLPDKGTAEEIWRTNVEGTGNIVDACIANRARRFVYASTDSVYGDGHSPGAREDAPIDPEYLFEGNYPRSKFEGERIAMRAGQQHGLEVAVVRPCLMYGPGHAIGNQILRTLAGKRFGVLYDGGRARLSLAYVGDVAQAMWLAGSVPEAAGRHYNASSATAYSHRELVEILSAVAGARRPRQLSLPSALVKPFFAPLHAVLRRLVPGKGRRFDPDLVAFFTNDHVIDISRARRELGYEPAMSLEDGFRQLLATPEGPRTLSDLDRLCNRITPPV